MESLQKFWLAYKSPIIKFGTLLALLPVVFFIGLVLFWLLSLVLSVVAALIVTLLGGLVMMAAWIYLQDRLLADNLPSTVVAPTDAESATQPVDVKVIK